MADLNRNDIEDGKRIIRRKQEHGNRLSVSIAR